MPPSPHSQRMAPEVLPLPWTPERLARLSKFQTDLQAEIDAGIGTSKHDPVKFHWIKDRFEVTYRDGQTYTEMRNEPR